MSPQAPDMKEKPDNIWIIRSIKNKRDAFE